MKTRIPLLFTSFLLAFSAFSPAVHAQEGEEGETAPAQYTQGQAAIILASRLGLFAEVDGLLTPQRASELLMARGIQPYAGWVLNQPLTANDLARILGQSMGLDGEFTDEQKSDETSQAYKDALLAEYDLDIDTIVAGDAPVDGTSTTGEGTAVTSGVPSEQDVLVDQEDASTAIGALIPVSGDGNQPDSGNDNATPSNTPG